MNRIFGHGELYFRHLIHSERLEPATIKQFYYLRTLLFSIRLDIEL